MVGCAASKRARLTLAVGERSLSAWNAGVSVAKPRNLLPHDGAVPGLCCFVAAALCGGYSFAAVMALIGITLMRLLISSTILS